MLIGLVILSLPACDNWNNLSGKFDRIAEKYDASPISFCFNCITRNDVIAFENNLESKKLDFGYFLTQRLGKNSFHPMSGYLDHRKDTINGNNYLIYKRLHSDLKGFNQLVVYLFHSNDTTIYTNDMRFYLGNNPFGYTPNPVESISADKVRVDRSQPITLESFQKAYYSVISWLHSEQGLEYKLDSERERGIFDDYFYGGNIEYGEYEFEDPWQKEFFFDWYRLESKFDEFDWKYSLHGVTHAPMRAYTSKDENGFLNPYELKLEDMAIRVDYYNRNLPPF